MITSNNNCKGKPCGCEDTPLTTPAPCVPIGCPDPYPCSEVSDAQCVIYTGPNLECGTNNVIETNTPLSTALENIVDYFCTNPESNITIVEAGDNVSVDVAVVGNITTYTVNAIIPCPMDVTITDSEVIARGYFASVTGGTAPYTYQWSLADNGNLALLTTPNGLPDIGIGLNQDPDCRFDTGGNISSGTMSLLKVTVTDANGCIAKDTFLWIEYGC